MIIIRYLTLNISIIFLNLFLKFLNVKLNLIEKIHSSLTFNLVFPSIYLMVILKGLMYLKSSKL